MHNGKFCGSQDSRKTTDPVGTEINKEDNLKVNKINLSWPFTEKMQYLILQKMFSPPDLKHRSDKLKGL